MDIPITYQTIGYMVGAFGVFFGVMNWVRSPQIKQDKESVRFEDRLLTLEKNVIEIREKHIVAVESDLKTLNTTLQDLSKTVVRLGTIIDERIPRSSSQPSITINK